MSPVDRSTPPGAAPIRAFDFPEVGRRKLDGGLDLRVARLARLPMVSVNLFVRAGESALGRPSAGLATLAGDTLEGGTRRRSGTELAESLERIGGRMGVTTGWEGTSVSMSCLAERLDEALGILAEALLEPDFPEDEVERAREQALAGIRQREMDPASLASDEASRRYFTPHVPYARPIEGSRDSVSGFGRSHLLGFADAYYKPDTGALVVVGDVTADDMRGLVQDRLGAWTGSPPESEDFQVEAATTERSVWLVHRPGSVQSEIRVGHVGVARSHPDAYALSVMNTLFGGAFTSRLNLNLRERNGFTYGVRSRFSMRSKPGPFHVHTAVGTDVTAAAVGEILSEMEALVTDGATGEEVAASRDYIAGVFPLRLETVGQVASRITELVVYGLQDDYHHTYRDRIREVSAEHVTEAARRHVRPQEAQIVVVGDADEVRRPLEELGIGPVEVVSPPE